MSAFCLIVTACGPRISINIFRQSAYYHILHATQPRLRLISRLLRKEKKNASQYYIYSAWSNLFRHMLRRSLCNDYYHCGSYISLLSPYRFHFFYFFFFSISFRLSAILSRDTIVRSYRFSLSRHSLSYNLLRPLSPSARR